MRTRARAPRERDIEGGVERKQGERVGERVGEGGRRREGKPARRQRDAS